MNEVGLLTLDSHTYNYGGALQQYALFSTICKLGFNCEVIDYKLKSEDTMFSYKRSLKYITLDKIVKKIRKRYEGKNDEKIVRQIQARQRMFELFRKENVILSAECDRAELYEIHKKYNTLVCGSDQIWNPAMTRPSFFLDFVDDKRKKVIYAASIGRDNLSKVESKVYRRYLNEIGHISVREERAKNILDKIGVSEDIAIVLDPTLLVDRNIWEKIAGETPLYRGQYVFCYYLDINENKRSAALSFADKYHLDIVSIPYLQEKYNALDMCFSNFTEPVGPSQFLNLILNAAYVLTDSFHASVFSILFNKQFRVFGRGRGKDSMDSRIETLLGYIEHKEYLLEPAELLNCNIQENEMYNLCLLNKKKTQSLNWLLNSLNSSI